MPESFVLVYVGCLECGNQTHVLGVYPSYEAALEAAGSKALRPFDHDKDGQDGHFGLAPKDGYPRTLVAWQDDRSGDLQIHRVPTDGTEVDHNETSGGVDG